MAGRGKEMFVRKINLDLLTSHLLWTDRTEGRREGNKDKEGKWGEMGKERERGERWRQKEIVTPSNGTHMLYCSPSKDTHMVYCSPSTDTHMVYSSPSTYTHMVFS